MDLFLYGLKPEDDIDELDHESILKLIDSGKLISFKEEGYELKEFCYDNGSFFVLDPKKLSKIIVEVTE